jgi:hypothetical protein
MRIGMARAVGAVFVVGLAVGTLFPVPSGAAGAAASGPGYRLEAQDGGIFTFGDARFQGSATTRCTFECFGFAATADGQGYWVLDNYPSANSGTSSLYGFGGVPDVSGLPSGASAVTSDATGKGGWVLDGQSGRVVPFGDALWYGDASNITVSGLSLTIPPYGTISYFQGIVGTSDGGGYWLVGEDGGVFSYGDAQFYGSTGGEHLNAPVAGIARTNDGRGYWLVAYDGGVFSFGDASFSGSMAGKPLNAIMISIAANPAGSGYWTAALDGGVFSFGDAPFLGSMGGRHLNQPVHSMAATG